MRGFLVATAVLMSGLCPGQAFAVGVVPAHAEMVAGRDSIPPDCKVWSEPSYAMGYSLCMARAHRVALYCNFGKFPIMGQWANKNEISQAQCDIGQSPTDVSVDFPD